MRYDELFDPNRSFWGEMIHNPTLAIVVGFVAFFVVVKVITVLLLITGHK